MNGLRCDIGRLYKLRATSAQQQQQQQLQNRKQTTADSTDIEWEVVGRWDDNQPSATFPFKINVPRVFEYWGYIALSKKRGLELLEIDDFQKVRQGELFTMESGTVFFGEFKHNMKNGFGVLQFGNISVVLI